MALTTLYTPLRFGIVLALLVLVHVLHPLVHVFEGGSLDILLVHADAFVAKIASE